MSRPGSALELEAVAARYDVPSDAVAIVLDALRRGGGRQAQFDHPALGGMGQWSQGGGVMIGDMFDRALKAKVGDLCNELARIWEDAASAGSAATPDDWWPSELGVPASVGKQNGASYAVFPDKRRLLIRTGSDLASYDTGDHRITGAAQRQSAGSSDLAFASQHGTLRLGDLKQTQQAPQGGEAEPTRGAVPNANRVADDRQDILGFIERLYDLQRRGIVTAEEFSAKKAELLARL